MRHIRALVSEIILVACLVGCAAPGGATSPAAGGGEMLSASGSAVVREASTWLGVPYVWGGNTRSGVDCSGLVKQVLTKLGMNVGYRVADAQIRNLCSPVMLPPGDRTSVLQPGDLIGFSQDGGGDYHHIGIYAGGGKMIHAPQPGESVSLSSLQGWQSETWAARRCAIGKE